MYDCGLILQHVQESWKMKNLVLFALIAFLWSLAAERHLSAQDLVITNARIIVGNGTVMERGSIVIRGGRLASVSAGGANVAGVPAIDAHGMTAMPGFIDAHRHINTGPMRSRKCRTFSTPAITP